MFPGRYFCTRYWPARYWVKSGSDVVHVIAATIFPAPLRRILMAPVRRWR
jgi:hypothetical protein